MASKLKGFALVEILVGFGLVGIVSVLVAALYLTNYKLFANQNTSIDVNSQNKIAVDEITNQIRQSQGVASSCCGGDTTGATVLVLQLWPLDASGDPKDPGVSSFDYIVYKQNPNNNKDLQRKIVPDASSTRVASTKIIATSLSSTGLQFTYNNATPSQSSEVTVAITTTGASSGKTQTVTQIGNGTLRNK